MYAIQGNHVRWFLSPEEDRHLFGLFDLNNVIAEIVISGNWNEGLTFKPVVYKSARGINANKGSYTVQPINGPDDLIVKTISVPLEALKLARFTNISSLKPSATVICKESRHSRELTVYPMQTIETTIIEQTEARKAPVLPLVKTPVSPISNEKPPTIQPQPPPKVPHTPLKAISSMSDDELVKWTAGLVAAINDILRDNPDIAANVGEDGVVKFSRKRITRKVIV
jgi:hypothetical protein